MVLDVDGLHGQTGEAQPTGLLWVLEQIPGTTESADVSHQLLKNGYWASFNVP